MNQPPLRSPQSIENVLDSLGAARVVSVVSFEDAHDARDVATALLSGGMSCIEITLRTPAALDAIRRARDVEGMLVGAGTVRSPEDARRASEAGAQFAMAPGSDEATILACRELGLPFLPGVATATELRRARVLGHDVVKVFPAATIGGPAFLRAIAVTEPGARFVPTGGIGPSDLADYLAVDAVLAVGGGWLTPPELVRERRFEEIERLAREAMELSA